MFRIRRSWVLTTGAVCCLGGLALMPLASGLLFPAPDRANPQALVRWILFCDLERQPRKTIEQVVDRLQYTVDPRTLGKSSHSSAMPQWLTSYFAQRAGHNIDLLKRVWFEMRTMQYHTRSSSQRTTYLERQIDALLQWSSALAATDASSQVDPDAYAESLQQFITSVEQWIRNAPAEVQQRMQAAVIDGVICWLATRPLSELPPTARQQLAQRLMHELSAGSAAARAADHQAAGALSSTGLVLNEVQQRQLRENVTLLVEAWLIEQAAQFDKVAATERDRFVDERIEQLEQLNVGRFLAGAPDSSASPANQLVAITALAAEATQRAQQLPSPERERVLGLLAHGQQRMLMRSLPKLRSWLGTTPTTNESSAAE